ncbi:MAG: penicillin-binding protein 2, partial [Planctomycetes bacterium]|nr:penicillin-binding protein 2 [Planctomycetota bacterium]
DARRRTLAEDASQADESRKGLSVVLSMDSTVQLITERALKKAIEQYTPESATAVVMDPFTGDVLAIASYPTFDPNQPAETPAENRMNLAVMSIMEPGSTFKPFVLASALDKGLVKLNAKYDCENGAWRMACGRVLHDAHGYGTLTAEMVLVKSSNIGIAKIADLLHPEGLYRTARHFGFGELSGIPMRGELKGLLHPLNKWTAYSMGSVPMGQEVAVTPLQLVTAYSSIANGGALLRPRIVRAVRHSDGGMVKDFPVVVRDPRVISPETAATMRKVLRKVVTEGTGRKLQMPEYPIGGKTGTAQLPVNAAEIAAGQKGYSSNRYVANFVGIAPYDVPRIVVAVAVREPKGAHYGGTVAGPVVKEICRDTLKYLGVPPQNLNVASR